MQFFSSQHWEEYEVSFQRCGLALSQMNLSTVQAPNNVSSTSWRSESSHVGWGQWDSISAPSTLSFIFLRAAKAEVVLLVDPMQNIVISLIESMQGSKRTRRTRIYLAPQQPKPAGVKWNSSGHLIPALSAIGVPVDPWNIVWHNSRQHAYYCTTCGLISLCRKKVRPLRERAKRYYCGSHTPRIAPTLRSLLEWFPCKYSSASKNGRKQKCSFQ